MTLALQLKYSRNQFLEFQGQRSLNNRQGASNAFNWFDKYLTSLGETEESFLPKLKEVKGQEEFYLFLNNFVQYMNQSLHAHSVETYLSFIKSYFRKQGFRIYHEDAKQFIDLPRKIKENRVPLEKKQIKTLLGSASPYMKMIITWLASSGMRTSELLQLEKSDVDFKADPIEVHVRAEITKTRAERLTFISHQAFDYMTRDMFRDYKPIGSLMNVEIQFSNLRRKCGFNQMYRTSRLHHITLHTFRSFFRTQAGMINADFAEDVLGHQGGGKGGDKGGYLKQYVRQTIDQKRDFYKQLEPKVTI